MVSRNDIQKMADIIVEKFHPEKIILFGSHARGEATEDSDVDLLIVQRTEEDFYERSVPIRKALLGFSCAFDILVRTPREFDAERNVYWTAVHDAATVGEVLYDRAS